MSPVICPSCRAADWKTLLPLRRKYVILRCTACGLLRSEGTPRAGTGEDEFGALDLDSYFKSMESLRKHSAGSLLERMERHIAPGAVLDVGCSFGWFLDVAQQRGWDPFGIEPSDVAVEHVSRRTNHQVKHGVFPEISFGEKRFEAAVMTDVLEHIADPVIMLQQLAAVVKPGGVIALRCPNREGLIYRAAVLLAQLPGGALDSPLWRMWQLDFPYPHLWYFDRATLANVVRQAGLEVLEVESEPVIRLGGVRDRIRYTNPGGNPLRAAILAAGLGSCAVAAQATGMHDVCLVVARVPLEGAV